MEKMLGSFSLTIPYDAVHNHDIQNLFLRINQLCEECKNMYPQFNTTMNIRVEVKSADGSPTLPEHLKIFNVNKTK
ncbi:MAG: hypothetical protein ACLTJ8_03805 [Veillonella atypica]